MEMRVKRRIADNESVAAWASIVDVNAPVTAASGENGDSAQRNKSKGEEARQVNAGINKNAGGNARQEAEEAGELKQSSAVTSRLWAQVANRWPSRCHA